MKVVEVVALVMSVVSVAHAHLCMWQPMQRSDGTNPFTIARPGEHACYHKPAPCGGVAYNPSATPTQLVAGDPFVMQFEQNLNHFDAQNPGFLDVSFAVGTNPQSDSDFVSLSFPLPDYDAHNMITVTNFSVPITVPSQQGPGVLRVRYASNNPGENDQGTTFHQCADVLILPPRIAAGPAARTAAAKPVAVAEKAPAQMVYRAPVVPHFKRLPTPAVAPTGCCTPRQFTVRASETGSYRSPTQTLIYYDAVRQLMRIDTVSGNGAGPNLWNGIFQVYLNFTGSEVGHLFNVNSGACDERGNPYGPDPWNDWCFGNANPSNQNESQTFVESVMFGNTPANVWQTGAFTFVSSADGQCTPLVQSRLDGSGSTTLYYDLVVGITDPTVFTPPAACNAQQNLSVSGRRPNAKALKALPRHIRNIRDAVLSRTL